MVLTVRRVIVVPAPCRRNANVGVSAMIRPENSVYTTLGRHQRNIGAILLDAVDKQVSITYRTQRTDLEFSGQ